MHSTILANPYYWAGNEPDLLAPWLFAYVPNGQPRTAAATRWIASHRYSAAADGLPGNDDYGTLSAWLLWAQLGLYPLAGSATFILGAPRFAEVLVGAGFATVDTTISDEPRFAPLRIVAHNASAAHTRVLRAEVNGRAIDLERSPFVSFAELTQPAAGKTEARLEVWLSA